MKVTNVTMYTCDRCGEERKYQGDAYPSLPREWSIDMSNQKMLCKNCNVLYERLRQAFYNPCGFDIRSMDYGIQILEKNHIAQGGKQ